MTSKRISTLARIRKICLALPEAQEKVAWGAPTFRVRDKQFAMFLDNHHGDGRLALWCKAPPGAQEGLVEADSERFFVPPYVGPQGWLGIHLDKGLDWGVIEGLVRDGYLEIAPKRLRATLETP
jgi:predicted DNA-binding protein (MmcQ/YjbR family)